MKLSPAQREVLTQLKHGGPQTVRQLGVRRRTLDILRRYGYVACELRGGSDDVEWRITARGINEAAG